MQRATVGFAVLGLAAAATIAAADGGGVSTGAMQNGSSSGMIYGEGHAFLLTAPVGWVLDSESGVKQGLHAVFYPAGSSWADAPAVMYANTAWRDTMKNEPLESFIVGDVSEARSKSSRLQVARVPAITTEDGKLAEVRVFTGDTWGNREKVAYIQERRVFVLLTLTAKSRASFARSAPAFDSLVRSYQFLTEKVEFK